ncbi:MAG: 23S rRNA (guanosine(2251)-2'-O)-methyltransferase RlmB [Gammaproteobacteria bacterium]
MQKNNQTRQGFHVVEALLEKNPSRIKKIFIPSERQDKRILNLTKKASSLGISIEKKNSLRKEPEALLINESALTQQDLKLAVKNPDRMITLLLIDNLSDPRNLGACIRSAAVANITGVVINKFHCSPMTETVRKVSAGGTETIPIYEVSNFVNIIKMLKDEGIEIVGTSEKALVPYTNLDMNKPIAIVVGSEEKGIREQTLKACDHIVNLSTNESFNSLNVSVASSIMIFEIIRQKI